MHSGMWGTIKISTRVRELLHVENSAGVWGHWTEGFVVGENFATPSFAFIFHKSLPMLLLICLRKLLTQNLNDRNYMFIFECHNTIKLIVNLEVNCNSWGCLHFINWVWKRFDEFTASARERFNEVASCSW